MVAVGFGLPWWGFSARNESGDPGWPDVLGAEAEPLTARMINEGVGEFQGEGAEAHQTGFHAIHDEGGGEHGPTAFAFDRPEAGPRLQVLPAVHLGA